MKKQNYQKQQIEGIEQTMCARELGFLQPRYAFSPECGRNHCCAIVFEPPTPLSVNCIAKTPDDIFIRVRIDRFFSPTVNMNIVQS